jgi:hypothetical protein
MDTKKAETEKTESQKNGFLPKRRKSLWGHRWRLGSRRRNRTRALSS